MTSRPVLHFACRALIAIFSPVRWAAFAVLAIFEPIARVVLAGLALLCLLVALFFRFFTELDAFPFWSMLAVSIGSLWLLAAYYGLLRLFAVDGRL